MIHLFLDSCSANHCSCWVPLLGKSSADVAGGGDHDQKDGDG